MKHNATFVICFLTSFNVDLTTVNKSHWLKLIIDLILPFFIALIIGLNFFFLNCEPQRLESLLYGQYSVLTVFEEQTMYMYSTFVICMLQLKKKRLIVKLTYLSYFLYFTWNMKEKHN